MVYLPTAGHDTPDDRERVEAYFGGILGYETEYLFLTDMGLSDEYIKNALLSADLIYVRGGNLKFLMDTWNRRGIVKYIRQAYENGTVLAGSSSGAMCWFDTGYDDCAVDDGFMFIRCAGILPYCICPHFQNENWHGFTRDVKMQELDGLAVDDSTALVYCDGRVSIIKNDPKPENSAYIMRAAEDYRLRDLSLPGEGFLL